MKSHLHLIPVRNRVALNLDELHHTQMRLMIFVVVMQKEGLAGNLKTLLLV